MKTIGFRELDNGDVVLRVDGKPVADGGSVTFTARALAWQLHELYSIGFEHGRQSQIDQGPTLRIEVDSGPRTRSVKRDAKGQITAITDEPAA